ncbi:uncharacterized protein UHOD_11121 [Ustilago sp. UG-2017b]|nr:uncharacterized protein UHOD_11121 [Ustilago sp. UG-2017b]
MSTTDPDRIRDTTFTRTDLTEICHRADSTTDLGELCRNSYNLPDSLISAFPSYEPMGLPASCAFRPMTTRAAIWVNVHPAHMCKEIAGMFEAVVRGLAPETWVGLSRYSVTIKLCDSYCLGIGLDELHRSATIKLHNDSGWCSLDMLSWLGTISIDTKVMMTPRSGVSVDDDEVDGVGDKVGNDKAGGVGGPTCRFPIHCVRGRAPETQVGLSGYSVTIKLRDDSGWRSLYMLSGSSARSISILIPGPQWTTAFGSILIQTAEWMRRYGYIPLHSVTSDAAPALSPESTFFIEYYAGGPSSATPVLLSCVASFDTAPPPQDLLAGLLYTAPPPSTGDGSFDSYLSSP